MNQREEIELYDIITLQDDSEYSVIKILNYQEEIYLLLAPISADEELDLEKIKIVKKINENNKILIEEVTEQNELQQISKLFLNSMQDLFK